MVTDTYNFASSGIFIETFILKPYKNGLLDGLTFAVKDNIDLEGHKTSYGSKSWGSAHKAGQFEPIYENLLTRKPQKQGLSEEPYSTGC